MIRLAVLLASFVLSGSSAALPAAKKPAEHGLAVFICGTLVGLSVFGPDGWEHYRWRSVLESESAVNRLRDVEFEDVYLTSEACAHIRDDL